MKVLIVGGAGAFGSFYAKLLPKNGFKVSILDKDTKTAKKLCNENDFECIWEQKNLEKFDVVIISVPNKVAPETIREIAPKLSKGTLLLDLCSVKAGPVKELKKLMGTGLELASVHPMHGPRVKNISGHPILCITIKPGKKLKALKKFFSSKGAKCMEVSLKEHDRMLSIVQGLTHYSQFVSAAVLKRLEVDLKKSAKVGSPNYHLFLSLMSRVILQNPAMYAEIQLSNPENKKIWAAFSKEAAEIEIICRAGNEETLKEKIIHSGQEFKGLDSFLSESDEAVNAINYFVTKKKKSN